jgi:hypothetical protein
MLYYNHGRTVYAMLPVNISESAAVFALCDVYHTVRMWLVS